MILDVNIVPVKIGGNTYLGIKKGKQIKYIDLVSWLNFDKNLKNLEEINDNIKK